MCVKTSIEWIRKYDIKLKKSFGQNFLKNQNISKKIIALLPEISNSTFIEIGPGAGSLTEELLNSGRDVHAFEIDRNLEELLNERFKGNKRFHLHMGDFLKIEVDEALKHKRIIAVSNLPYNTGTAIIKKIKKDFPNLEMCLFMLQTEVCERFGAKPGTKPYGSLSIFIQYHFDLALEFKVSKKNFVPEPKIESSIIRMIPKENKPLGDDPENFFEFVKTGFSQRRKKMKNNYKTDITQSLKEAGLSEAVRAEELSLEKWIELYNIEKRSEKNHSDIADPGGETR